MEFINYLILFLTTICFVTSQDILLRETTELIMKNRSIRSNSIIGSPCNQNVESGICVLIENCDFVRTLFSTSNPDKLNIISDMICSYDRVSKITGVCCPNTQNTSTRIGPGNTQSGIVQPLIPSLDECGKSLRSRIVNGQRTKAGDWPWLAAIGLFSFGSNFELLCGGSLITRKHVLTAAHCFTGFKIPTHVRLGDHDLHSSSDGVTPQDVRITRHIEADYDAIRHINDISLIYLGTDVLFNDFIKPVCLPFAFQDSGFVGQNLTVVGRGKTNFGAVFQTESKPLQALVDVASISLCQDKYSEVNPSPIIDNRILCIGTKDTDSCQGDSGGPLNYLSNNNDYVVGVISYGVKCGTIGFPGVHMRVGAYLDWIKNNLI